MASTFILTALGIKRAPKDELDLQYNLHTLMSLRSIAYQHITRPLCSPSLVSPVVTPSSATIIFTRDCCLTFLRKLVRPRFALKYSVVPASHLTIAVLPSCMSWISCTYLAAIPVLAMHFHSHCRRTLSLSFLTPLLFCARAS